MYTIFLMLAALFCFFHAGWRWSLIGKNDHPARFSPDPFNFPDAFMFAFSVVVGLLAVGLIFMPRY